MIREYRKFLAEFQAYLKHYKSATGKSQREIGRAAGLSQKCISNHLRGISKPNSQTLFQILYSTGRGDVLEGKLRIKLKEVRKSA